MAPNIATQKEQQASANLYVRIPVGQQQMLKHIADRLRVSLTSVVAAIIDWNLVTARNQNLWMQAVAILRELVDEDDQGVMLFDFDDSAWHDRLHNYQAMSEIGIIDALRYRRSASGTRWLCSFRLTATGRVIASMLDQAKDNEG